MRQSEIQAMNINRKTFRTIWVEPDDEKIIQIVDQRYLPHQFIIEDLETVDQMGSMALATLPFPNGY